MSFARRPEIQPPASEEHELFDLGASGLSVNRNPHYRGSSQSNQGHSQPYSSADRLAELSKRYGGSDSFADIDDLLQDSDDDDY
ncbi:hypothetical protein [Candidatus Odyssella thessalonicensis]|uniref:hypothetical protein n=1 Tax=Candidatus Odyssella thessalonicensis TaxID=84647 RepID=UPI0011124605|nr:hypothetical protein [Candidatus Odyssella thessalonicensis]